MALARALLIDLDGVIRCWHGQDDPDTERGFGLPPGSVRRIAFAPERLLPAITGTISDGAWRTQIGAALAQEFPDADTAGALRWWSASPGQVDLDVLELVTMCRRSSPVILVTNATSRLPDDLHRLGLATAFDHVINSSSIGVAKPEPTIFAAALAAAGVAAPTALFVDDSPANVEAARHLGLIGHQYIGVTELRGALQMCGLC